MVNQMSPQDRLKAISVKEVMNRRPHITGIKLEKNKTEDKVSLTVDIIGLFKDKVTRLPIFTETDAAKYVIHESLAYKFVYEHRIAKKDPTLQPNLQDLLNNPADDGASLRQRDGFFGGREGADETGPKMSGHFRHEERPIGRTGSRMDYQCRHRQGGGI